MSRESSLCPCCNSTVWCRDQEEPRTVRIHPDRYPDGTDQCVLCFDCCYQHRPSEPCGKKSNWYLTP